MQTPIVPEHCELLDAMYVLYSLQPWYVFTMCQYQSNIFVLETDL